MEDIPVPLVAVTCNTAFAGVTFVAGMSVLFLWESGEESAIVLDGEVDDWKGYSQTEQEQNNVDSANIDIVRTGAVSDSIYLSLLTTTEEPMFASAEGKTIRILIDSDNSEYWVRNTRNGCRPNG